MFLEIVVCEWVWSGGVHALCTVGVFVRVHGGVIESGVSVHVVHVHGGVSGSGVNVCA